METQATANKDIREFRFSNSYSRNDQAITDEFSRHHLIVADISRECGDLWTWVLLENGDLWVLDKTHGCGGVFQLHKRN